jgi:hypothetical protein
LEENKGPVSWVDNKDTGEELHYDKILLTKLNYEKYMKEDKLFKSKTKIGGSKKVEEKKSFFDSFY